MENSINNFVSLVNEIEKLPLSRECHEKIVECEKELSYMIDHFDENIDPESKKRLNASYFKAFLFCTRMKESIDPKEDTEPEKFKQLRNRIKLSLQKPKAIACAVVVLSVTASFFGIISGISIGGSLGAFLATTSLIIGIACSIFSYDVMLAAKKGAQIADQKEKFYVLRYFDFLNTKGPAKTIALKLLIKEAIDNTFLFKRRSSELTEFVNVQNFLKILN